jgi:ABC-2 type transport system permease protein
MRSVFLPPEAAVLEIAGSFESARTAQVLLLWLVLAAVLATVTFRWNRRGEN